MERNVYEGVENLKRFNSKSFKKYCDNKLNSVDKHITFIKKNVIDNDYKGRVLEIGSGNGKLLFRMEKEKILEEGIGCEISKSRSKFSNCFKKKYNFKKVKIINNDFFNIKFKKNYFDLIIGTDVVINFIGGSRKSNAKLLLNKCLQYLKGSGKLVMEFMTFEREIKFIKQSSNKKYLTWKKFEDSDPFIFGLDEMSFNKKKIIWMKYFIPRNFNKSSGKKIENFYHKMLPLNKNYFLKKHFIIFNRWCKNDDTHDQEYIAFQKRAK